MNMASVVQPIWCRWGCRCFLPSLLSFYPSMLLMTMRVMGVFQQPLCCCRCCRCCCWLWFTGLTLQCCWWRWGCWVYFNNRCGFLALQSYESCLVLRRSRLSCVNKRFISGSSWAWWRWWCWWLEGLCVSVCNVLSSLLNAYDEVCVFVCLWRWSSLFLHILRFFHHAFWVAIGIINGLRLSRIKRSQVMSMGQFGPTALNFG